MANTVMTVKAAGTIIAKSAAEMFKEKSQMVKAVDKEDAAIFAGSYLGVQPGDTFNVRKPARFPTNNTLDITNAIQNIVEEKTPLQLNNVINVPIAMNTQEILTDKGLKRWNKDLLEPAMASISAGVDQALIALVINATANQVGTPGVASGAQLTWNQANQKLTEHCAPQDTNRFGLVAPATMTAMVDYRKGLLNPGPELSKMFKTGLLGQGDGFNYLSNNLLPTYTTGTQAGYLSALSNGATQSGSSIAIDGMGAGATITKGTIVTFNGVYEVNPLTYQAYDYLKQFVVTADTTLSGGGAGNLPISPALDASSAGTKNASSTIADNSQITFMSGTVATTAYRQNIAFHKSAIRFLSAPQMLPNGVHMAEEVTEDGITMRVIMFYDGYLDKMVMRLQCLWGAVVVRPEWCCRVTN